MCMIYSINYSKAWKSNVISVCLELANKIGDYFFSYTASITSYQMCRNSHQDKPLSTNIAQLAAWVMGLVNPQLKIDN